VGENLKRLFLKKMKIINRLFFTTLILAILTSACEGSSSVTPTAIVTKTITLQPTISLNSLTQTSISTVLPTEVVTLSPEVSPISNRTIHLAYNPIDWTLWFESKDAPEGITTDAFGQMWAIVHEEVSYFDGQNWVQVGPKGLNLSILYQLHIEKGGIIWVLGKLEGKTFLARYYAKNWKEFPLPETISTSRLITMAIDSSNRIWVGAMDCYTDQCLFTFLDGVWQDKQLPVRQTILGGVDVISDSGGNIWVCGGGYEGIAEHLDKDWHIYLGEDLWPERPFMGFRSAEQISISAGLNGSIWAYLEGTPWIINIKKDSSIEKLPIGLGIDYQNLTYIIMQESQGTLLWVGIERRADFSGQTSTALGYFDGAQWVSFTNLPFQLIYSIDETPDGIILILTENGLYRYEPR